MPQKRQGFFRFFVSEIKILKKLKKGIDKMKFI